MLKLNKLQCFFLGLGVIFLFYFLNRTKYIIGSEKVKGELAYYVVGNDSTEGKLVYPVIEYKVQNTIYHFRGREGAGYELHEELPVLLQHDDPNQPLLFTFGSFWLYPLFYIILPVLIWSAFSLSYINKNELVKINLKYPFFRKEKRVGKVEKKVS